MSRYEAMFRRCGNAGVFGAFLTLGDPDLETCAAILDELVAGGADMIEVGIPFSDPIADGPVIRSTAFVGPCAPAPRCSPRVNAPASTPCSPTMLTPRSR